MKAVTPPTSQFAALALAGFLHLAPAAEQPNLPSLTTATQVKQLTSEQAALHYPVHIHGVVTFVAEPIEQLFIQDESGGIFVEIHGDYGFHMRPGHLLEIQGVSSPGGFAPDIDPLEIRLLGDGPLPPARRVTYDQMAAGQEDCNRVELSGIVRAVRDTPPTWAGLDIAAGGGRVIVALGQLDLESCRRLVDAEVSVRGVCIARFNRLGQLIEVALQAPSMDAIAVTKAAPADPYAIPLRKCSRLYQYAPEEANGHRVRVRGVVTFQQAGRALFLADETQSLCVESRLTTVVQPGDVVEVLGFPAAGEYVSPVLQDAVFRKIASGPLAHPIRIAAEDGNRDTNHAALVQLEAVVLNRIERFKDQTLQLKSGSVVFDAHSELSEKQNRFLASIPDGSRVLVSGICLVPANLHLLSRSPQTFSILLRSGADIKLLERPSWWTVRHMLWVLAVTLTVFCASLAWVAVLHNRVRAQTEVIRQTVQREAALEERTRIARDLHDELGSSLTQIALLSDRPEPKTTSELSENVRKISVTAGEMAQSLDEIVWAVNPQHDTLEGLVEYLSQSADDFLEETPIRSRVRLPTFLPPCAIPAEVRHQLFLAFREALNNAIKHAAASEMQIELAASPTQFQIIVADNGIGFDPLLPHVNGNGLSNMRQRLETIGGTFELSSHRARGTVIKLTIPLSPSPQALAT
jgi:signal transduction histidine kinase